MSPSSAPFGEAHALMIEAVARRVAPCAVAEVGRANGAIWREAAGALSYGRSASLATADTIFDLASLTKVLATTTLAMRLVDDGRLTIENQVRDLVPGWGSADRERVTVRDLLAHSAGLPAYFPLYRRCAGRAEFEQAICAASLEYVPGTRSVYSDLGFILLGFILEDLGGASLNRQFTAVAKNFVAGADEWLRYGPIAPMSAGGAPAAVQRVAPTRVDEWRSGRLLHGEVDDRNAAALGGVAGHSGIFGSVVPVGRFAREILRGRLGDASHLVARPDTIARFTVRGSVTGSSRAFGWDTMLPTSSCGTLMSPEAFGHTGFTGTTVWIDPVADVYVVLLTNRVHPEAGSGEPIRQLRRAFHDAVMKVISGWQPDLQRHSETPGH